MLKLTYHLEDLCKECACSGKHAQNIRYNSGL